MGGGLNIKQHHTSRTLNQYPRFASFWCEIDKSMNLWKQHL